MTAESSIAVASDNTAVSQTNRARDSELLLYLRRCRKADATAVTSHWGHLFESFSFSSREFYGRVEQALQQRDVPELTTSHVVWKEGGVLSPRREYLRVQRGRSVFDICAAPFGTGFFVSSWAGEKPLKLGWLFFLLLFIALIAYSELPNQYPQTYQQRTYYDAQHGRWTTSWVPEPISIPRAPLYPSVSRYFSWPEFTRAMRIILWTCLLVALGLVVYFPDATLTRIPLVGYIYVKYFRKITYYRLDLHACYERAVHSAVTQVVDEITKAHGLRPLSEEERAPNHRDFFSTLMPHVRRH